MFIKQVTESGFLCILYFLGASSKLSANDRVDFPSKTTLLQTEDRTINNENESAIELNQDKELKAESIASEGSDTIKNVSRKILVFINVISGGGDISLGIKIVKYKEKIYEIFGNHQKSTFVD